MALGREIGRLAKHSAIYGLGGLVSRILAVLLLPLYTRYLTPADYGAVETVVALTAVLVTVLRFGISAAFFRFYFDSPDPADRLRVVRTSFWFTMASSTVGLAAGVVLAEPISHAFFATGDRDSLVRAAFVALWAQMNYEQLTSLFRVEERSGQFVLASLTNVLITVAATVGLVVGAGLGATGVVVGNFSGTLCVYAALLAYRREQLGLQFSRPLLREMNRFGMPLVPSALALWALHFSDRFFLVKLDGADEVGLYSIGARLASAMVLLLTAFRMAWPAFAYSIDDEREARRTYGFVLTYLLFVTSWLALALGLLAPWLVRFLTVEDFYEASQVVPVLAFGAAAFGGYIVISIGVGRARRTQFNWVVTGAAAALNVALNLILIPPYGMMGAAVANVAAYTTMFAAMAWWSQRVYPVPYQWRRVVTLGAIAVGLCVLGKEVDAGLPLAIALTLVYPLALLPAGFYLPAELKRIRRLLPAR
jgi:O-antigen/teichoic acid export membrane protein